MLLPNAANGGHKPACNAEWEGDDIMIFIWSIIVILMIMLVVACVYGY